MTISRKNEKKKLLIITSNFFPEFTGIGAYTSDLAFEIFSDKFQVTVLTGLPHYPWWRVLDIHKNYVPGKSNIKKVTIFRFSHFIPSRMNILTRVLYELSFWKNAIQANRRLEDKFDIVVAVTPSVSSALVARQICKKTKIPGVVVFQDLAFSALKQSGVSKSKSRLLFSFIAKKIEAFSTEWASETIAISESMAKGILSNFKKIKSIRVIYNYTLLEPINLSHSECKVKLGIEKNQFLILHAGNIGFKQDLLNITKAANLLRDKPNINFVIIGNGSQEKEIINATSNSTNITYSNLVENELFLTYLKAADVLLLNERASVRDMSLPSKVTAYASAGRPLIAAISRESATYDLLGNAAYIIEPGNPRALANAILVLKEDKGLAYSLSKKIEKLADEVFSAKIARDSYFSAIQELLGDNSNLLK
jgi:glycosyltransferase involved in cell wall biosynthesis